MNVAAALSSRKRGGNDGLHSRRGKLSGRSPSRQRASRLRGTGKTGTRGDGRSIEASGGLAICDTDPLKLHFSWSLWQAGEAPQSQWRLQCEATRQALADEKLGFADLYLVKRIDPAIARRQRDDDLTRPRPRFDLHLRLQEPLMAWYHTLAAVLPGQVVWRVPDEFSLGKRRVPKWFQIQCRGVRRVYRSSSGEALKSQWRSQRRQRCR